MTAKNKQIFQKCNLLATNVLPYMMHYYQLLDCKQLSERNSKNLYSNAISKKREKGKVSEETHLKPRLSMFKLFIVVCGANFYNHITSDYGKDIIFNG